LHFPKILENWSKTPPENNRNESSIATLKSNTTKPEREILKS
jgi:hypothetical protein